MDKLKKSENEEHELIINETRKLKEILKPHMEVSRLIIASYENEKFLWCFFGSLLCLLFKKAVLNE